MFAAHHQAGLHNIIVEFGLFLFVNFEIEFPKKEFAAKEKLEIVIRAAHFDFAQYAGLYPQIDNLTFPF